ncbi:MAG TPA: M14 family metallopeptidase [Gaiellaceae bacterium]
MPYLTTTAIEQCLQFLANTYPQIVTQMALPEPSPEGRTSHAIKIAKGTGDRHGVLLIGGVHARELVNPDLLVAFALKLCQAYSGNTGLTYGAKSYGAVDVKLIVETLDTIIFPLVNPDGRTYVQAAGGDAWWRKNRAHHAGTTCVGVDLNRNFDFLWSSGIGTSTDPCEYQIYRGPTAFSEPESRNVRHLLDTFPHVECMIDVHSFSEDFLYPWGDDENQSSNTSMNFMNPAFDGMRGVPGDVTYKEYIPQTDWDWFVRTGKRVTDAINAVRGRTYVPKESIGLYPTSGTSDDYAYARHFVDGSKRRVYAFTLETGREFQPVYSEALQIIDEVSAGLVEFCLACICVIEDVATSAKLTDRLGELQAVRIQLAKSKTGRAWVDALERNTPALMRAFQANKTLRKQAAEILSEAADAVGPRAPKGGGISKELVKRADDLAQQLSKRDATLAKALKPVRPQLKKLGGRTLAAGLKEIDRPVRRPASPRKSSK